MPRGEPIFELDRLRAFKEIEGEETVKNTNWVIRLASDLVLFGVCFFSIMGVIIVGMSFANAAGGLVVTPQLVELDSRQRSKVLTLANRGTKAETYRVTVVNFRMDSGGNLHPVETAPAEESFATDLFRYAPRQITLRPGKPQTVRILYRRPANLKDGEYRSHLMFQQIPEAAAVASNERGGTGLSVKIRTIFGITIPVLVRHGKLDSSGELTEVKTATINEKPGIAVRIARSGTRSLRGDLVALSGGDEVGRLNNVAVYLSTQYRDVVMPLAPESAENASGQDIVVEYRPRGQADGPLIASGSVRFN